LAQAIFAGLNVLDMKSPRHAIDYQPRGFAVNVARFHAGRCATGSDRTAAGVTVESRMTLSTAPSIF
jgi:hypothetical protein